MERMRALRKARGLTQRELADALGIDRTTYTKYERGQSEPSLATLRQLSALFDVTVDYLIGDTDDPTESPPLQSFAAIGDVNLDTLTDDERAQLQDFAKYLLSRREE